MYRKLCDQRHAALSSIGYSVLNILSELFMSTKHSNEISDADLAKAIASSSGPEGLTDNERAALKQRLDVEVTKWQDRIKAETKGPRPPVKPYGRSQIPPFWPERMCAKKLARPKETLLLTTA
jgi:hypothetical protein